MEPRDCTWCGSAQSIEYAVCQVCLMRFPEDETEQRVVVTLEPQGLEVEESVAADTEAAAAE
jgi:hypothetical protein